MPGSVTISHTDALVMLSHTDAERLATMLRTMSDLLTEPGPDRLADGQAAALRAGGTQTREDLATWSRKLSEYLRAHL